MPQCPHCQTEYDQGQRYCSVCGSFLLHPEEGDTFCPQCGVRVSSRQEFCHECDAPLKGEGLRKVEIAPGVAPPEPAPEPAGAPASAALPSWVIGALAGAGIIIIILLIVIFSRTSPTPAPPAPTPQAVAPAPPAPAVTPSPPAAPAPAPTAPEEELKGKLQKVLSTLRDAQLKKNITEYMSVYAANFPNSEQKRQDTLNSWESYEYANLVFTVDKIQTIDANNALAWVTWYMDIRNIKNKELSSATQTYQVRFVQEQGNWHIQELKEVQ